MPVIASADDAQPTRRRANSNGTGFWLTSYIGANRYTRRRRRRPGGRAVSHGVPGGAGPWRGGGRALPSGGPVPGDGRWQRTTWNAWGGGERRCISPAPGRHMGRSPPATRGCNISRCAMAGIPGHAIWNSPTTAPRCAPCRAGTARRWARSPQLRMGCGRGIAQVAAGEGVNGPDPASGGGQFWLVLSGSLRHDGRTLPPRSCVFVHPEEGPLSAVAGADGLEAVAMQFPRRADRSRRCDPIAGITGDLSRSGHDLGPSSAISD